MFAIRMTALAVDDLEELWLYVSEHDVDAADRVVDGVGGLINLLSAQPEMGAPRDDLGLGLRCLVYKRRFLVFYRFKNGAVEVLRILRGERFLSSGLFDEP